MLDPLILRIISVGFALLFIFAAAHKFNNKLQFLGILEAYQILPGTMPGLAVNVIPDECHAPVHLCDGYRH